jgi:hypothetical protein
MKSGHHYFSLFVTQWKHGDYWVKMLSNIVSYAAQTDRRNLAKGIIHAS